MIRTKPSSSMQKTYDDAYLMCSTAVYFESQNNEAEALRSWRSALDTIYYHNAYKVPSGWRPRTGMEKALHDSLRQMETRCKERVDLLSALRESREESKSKSATSLVGDDASGSNGYGSDTAVVGGTTSRTTQPGWLGGGTIPPVEQSSLPRPPQLPVRPSIGSRRSSDRRESGPVAGQSSPSASRTSLAPDTAAQRRGSRTPSPEKKGMLRTLRSGGAKRDKERTSSAASRKGDTRPPAAARAATQAWSSTGFAASDVTLVAGGRMDDGYVRKTSDDEQYRRPSDMLKHRASATSIASSLEVRKEVDQEDVRRDGELVGVLPPVQMPAYRQEYPAPPPSKYTKPPLATPPRRWDQRATSAPVPQAPSPGSSRVPRKAVGVVAAMQARQQLDDDHGSTVPSAPSSTADRSRTAPAKTRPVPPEKRAHLAEVSTIPSISEPSTPRPVTNEDLWAEKKARVLSHLPANIDATAATQILNEVVVRSDPVQWSDISGLTTAKLALKENVIYPFLRPDLFRGLREPARGILLFGPPGTGKTMLARAVATESKSTFFSIGASSLTSKFLGESEKLVRALFAVARMCGPSIVFIDEIESLLGRRGEGGHDALERVKTEFLVGWSELQRAAAGAVASDGPATAEEEGDASRVLVLAATNLPWLIDEAARRRFVRRQYIPLPEADTRRAQLEKLLEKQRCDVRLRELDELVRLTDGFSGSDITSLAKDAAMGPLRALGERLLDTAPEDIRPIQMRDFQASLVNIRPSVSKAGLKEFEDWAAEFGERGG